MTDTKTYNDSFTSMIHRFNVNSSIWDEPIVSGNPPERRRCIKAVFNSGKLYIFGGAADEYLGSPTTRVFNDMVIFDTVELSWTIDLPDNALTRRIGHTAT